ncbi:MAG: molybdate ABC transporter permease subunit [Beijerinckiaceae bacterium]|nr:molybdate ABC transporter permease subunit [Beijerinckiaceae bacterium]
MNDWLHLTPQEWDAVHISLKVAFWGTLCTLPFGIALAFLLSRGRFPGRAWLDALVHLPLVMPPVVTGYVLLILLGRKGVIGSFLADHFGIVFSFRWTGAALASAIMGLPLMVRAIRLSFDAVHRRHEEAAATLGASPILVFFTVSLPLAWPGVIAGAILCFAKALGEFGATITFVSAIPGETETISAAIFAALQTPGAEDTVWRLALVSIVISFAALLAAQAMTRRNRSRAGGI